MTKSPHALSLPAPSEKQTYVTISALEAGHLTLPEHLFVTNAAPEKRTTVPSLAFLIRHPSPSKILPSQSTNLIFDLGLKRDFTKYRTAQQHHASQRQPTITSLDAAASLRAGGVDPEKDVDTVILSHVHWDHVGTPSDFPNSNFVVGSGTLHLLANGAGPLYPAELFNADELPFDRTYELPSSNSSDAGKAAKQQTAHKWEPLADFPAVVDYFGDGSVYVVDSPGHLIGHVNLLARISPTKWVYLGGDCCHDVRILTGESDVAMYDDGRGGLRSVHLDTDAAKETISRIGGLLKRGEVVTDGGGEVDVEVVVAHDKGWSEGNKGRFLPGHL
ncbi:uncharacterized protein LY89DRAFT_239627 [Mollisia scopiformis]|uniref:Metallo-beta-lactamase domain-containing protein n=1 Tax=Mollisia scopiformis TaxID=149040 RepID=A0A194WU56_MOLSC|nr:uncharacterized protein LY89DRAFT_239627 [Mollisia scopiformis]KUJ11209.1 hypothetical protein LY89DRAFT_239627 [Mollisia scopiformis]